MTDRWETGPNPWIIKSTDVVHQDDWLRVEKNEVVRPDKSEGEYTIVRVQKRGIGIIPIEDDGTVYLVGQWRLPLGRYSWELPEGGVEPGEDELDAAKRELSEEAGLLAATWIKVLELDLSTSLTDERATIFIATGLSKGAAHPESVEVLRRRRASFPDLLKRIGDGQFREAMSVAGVLRAHAMATNGELPETLAHLILASSD